MRAAIYARVSTLDQEPENQLAEPGVEAATSRKTKTRNPYMPCRSSGVFTAISVGAPAAWTLYDTSSIATAVR